MPIFNTDNVQHIRTDQYINKKGKEKEQVPRANVVQYMKTKEDLHGPHHYRHADEHEDYIDEKHLCRILQFPATIQYHYWSHADIIHFL